jgi:hypothetical protein
MMKTEVSFWQMMLDSKDEGIDNALCQFGAVCGAE